MLSVKPGHEQGGAERAVHCGYLHTSVGASGGAASGPLTWHAVLRLPRAGRDHVEDLGGVLVGGAVGFLGAAAAAAAAQRWPRRAGTVLSFLFLIPFVLGPSSQRWTQEHEGGDC